jgi:hypothetical protein
MPQVSIAQDALAELRERMAKHQNPTGLLIMGPMEEDPRAPESLEEAWALEKVYGPPQRWILDILPLGVLNQVPVETREVFYSQDVAGIHVGVLSTCPVNLLRVELHGDSIRVFEPDA